MTSRLRSFHKNPRAILFDLDDTIITDDAISEKAWRMVCQRYAPQVGEISADVLYDNIRKVSKIYWSDLENHRIGRLNLKETRRKLVRLAFHEMGFTDQDELAYIISDTFTAEKEANVKPIPGAIETLQYFKDIGLSLALITNGGADVQRRKINRFRLKPFFDLILIEGEFGVGKPHPSVFITAMEKLNTDTSDVWMVGDDLARDITGAQSLGIYSIWVDWRGSGVPESSIVHPDRIVRRINQLSKK